MACKKLCLRARPCCDRSASCGVTPCPDWHQCHTEFSVKPHQCHTESAVSDHNISSVTSHHCISVTLGQGWQTTDQYAADVDKHLSMLRCLESLIKPAGNVCSRLWGHKQTREGVRLVLFCLHCTHKKSTEQTVQTLWHSWSHVYAEFAVTFSCFL